MAALKTAVRHARAAQERLALRNTNTGRVVATDLRAAVDRRSRRRGLLGTDTLEDGQALLLAPCMAIHTWFMHYDVDVVFLDGTGMVRAVCPKLAPWRMAASLSAYAVLELPAGTIARGGVRVGDRLEIEPHDDEW